MGHASGQVYKIFENTIGGTSRFAGQTSYKIKLDGQEPYYGCFINRPSCNAGDVVEFDYTTNDKGFHNVDLKTLKVTGGGSAPAPAGGGTAQVSAPAGNSRDNYWAEKDRYDKEIRQPLICYQSAHKDAVTIACAALAADIIPLGQKKAGKLDVFKELVNKLTDEIYLKYDMANKNLEAGKPIVDPQATKLAENAQEAKENPAPDEWADASDPNLPF